MIAVTFLRILLFSSSFSFALLSIVNARGPALALRYPHLQGGKPCSFENSIFKSGEMIPRRNPCHICVCVRGYVQCFWQRCPPPPDGCYEMTYKNICNPSIYNCSIPERALPDSKVSLIRAKYGSRKFGDRPVKGDCVIRGISYFTGEIIGVATSNCLECRCAKNSMYCTPLCCYEHTTSVEEEAEKKYRFQQEKRPLDPNPLAHISEELGLPPRGAI
ncbi:filaggrin-like protein [Dinothrombium tinctorium]|uniref:Filaggrin-like protein n=1 Tax=Dinothrombium tinctorium TaxID=1965070 RepID=A0A3S4RD16_9ACAR|nr:filaggrin-like protein [Dinothrombium tinctorium]